MKKFFVVFSLVLSICLISFYHIDSFAIDKTSIVIHTKSSVSGFASGDYASYLNACYTSVIPNDFYDHINSLPSDVNSFEHYVCFGDGSNSLYLFCFDAPTNSEIGMIYADFYPDTDFGSNSYYWKVPSKVAPDHYLCLNYNYNAGVWSPSTSSFSIMQDGVNFYTVNSAYKSYIYDTDLYLVCDRQGTMSNLFQNNSYENQDNLSPSDLPYIDSDGSVVDPSVQFESNKNHMYFKDCEIGFCYPKSSPAPLSFGGAYFYIKYQVDDWIVNHISDYNLVFYADAEVGNEVTNTIRYEIALDPDGCITIPFSRVWSTPLTSKGFSVLVTDREIEDNFYKAYLYSLSPSGFVDFGNKAAASNQSSISGALNALSSGGIRSFLYYINGDSIDLYSALSDVTNSIAFKYNPYLITSFTLLTDGRDNSGLFEMQFDLVAGTEDVTDTGGLVNPDPFVPEDNPDFTPPAPTPGNSTTPGYNIVPSGFWQGTMNAVIGYDPGYRDLKNDVNNDPNGNFSQYLDPMHNDDVGSWFMSFVNEMPTEMKSILIAGVGVGVLFGLYRFIRRG